MPATDPRQLARVRAQNRARSELVRQKPDTYKELYDRFLDEEFEKLDLPRKVPLGRKPEEG